MYNMALSVLSVLVFIHLSIPFPKKQTLFFHYIIFLGNFGTHTRFTNQQSPNTQISLSALVATFPQGTA